MSTSIEHVGLGLIADGVERDEQRMSPEKVFFAHLCTNLAPSGWVLGALLAGIDLDVRWGIVAIVLGNALGTIPVSLCSVMGPQTGLTQIETSRFSFGRFGTRVPALLNWCGAVGWDAVNNVPSTLAIVGLALLAGVRMPFWAALAILSAVQIGASMCGHHVVQLIGKYLGWALALIFTATGIVAVLHGGSLNVPHAAVTPATFVLGVSLAAGFAIGFAPYSSDYTRYLPRATSPRRIAALSFFGLTSAGIGLEVCGLLTVSRMHDLSPAGVIGSIAVLTGAFAPIALLAVAASAITVNSYNDNTAAYSLMSAGIRLPRHVAAALTAGLGYALAVVGAGTFAELFANYMLVLLYWIAPWAAIVAADWYLFRSVRPAPRRWGPGATIFAIVTPLTIALFSATEVYTGPIARLFGGADIGYFVGFFAAGAAYVVVERQTLKRRSPDALAAARAS